jgi:hypothetical protein
MTAKTLQRRREYEYFANSCATLALAPVVVVVIAMAAASHLLVRKRNKGRQIINERVKVSDLLDHIGFGHETIFLLMAHL